MQEMNESFLGIKNNGAQNLSQKKNDVIISTQIGDRSYVKKSTPTKTSTKIQGAMK